MKKRDERIEKAIEEIIFNIDTGLKVLRNKNRRDILHLTRHNPMKITDISKKLKISYKVLWEHIKILEKGSLLEVRKKKKEQGQPVYVESYLNAEEELMSIEALIHTSLERIERVKR